MPEVVARRPELDSWDVVEGLQLPDETDLEVLTSICLRGGLTGAWPGPPLTARHIVLTVVRLWQEMGCRHQSPFG